MPLRTCRPRGAGLLGHGLWGPTIDIGDGTVLKLVRHRAGIGDGLDILRQRGACAGGARRPAGSARWQFRGSLRTAHLRPDTSAAAHGYAAWLRLSRVAGKPFGEERLARLSGRERDRFAASFGETIATLQTRGHRVLGGSAVPR